MLNERFERLNALARIISATKYLEIGVAAGDTFTRVDVAYKVAVDPTFKFPIHSYSNHFTKFHEVTSDFFFTNLAAEHEQFDLIFLDGLHTFEQTFRDFCASLRYSHANTIWVIDDTYPSDWFAANPHRRMVQRLGNAIGIKDCRWMGDVFKVIFAIHDFFPQFRYATFPVHSQTAVWLETRTHFQPTWNSLRKISRLGYWHFLKFRDSHLAVMEADTILDLVRTNTRALAQPLRSCHMSQA